MLGSYGLLRGTYGFLAVQDSIPGGVLVVEGWAPDHAIERALAEFRGHRYEGLFVTGGPLEQGTFLSEHQTFAQLGAATLLRIGADPQTLHAVPAPRVRQDRTYASAVALREWLSAHHIAMEKVNLVSLGAHARRSRMLFQRAFGPATQIGVIAAEEREFDPAHWWRSSSGFRIVSGEVIAYVYARCFFRPKADSDTATK